MFASSILITALAGCGGGSEATTASGGQGGGTTSTGQGGGGGTSSSSTGTGGATASSSSGTGGAGGGTGGAGGGTGGESSGTGGGMPCAWGPNNTCGVGMYCDATGCGMGTCAPLGQNEDAVKGPVCGCDGVTYWNASVAQKHGMAVAAAGECAVPKTCGGFAGLQCPQGATCSHEVPSSGECNIADFGGTCWVVPANCNDGGASGNPKSRACGSATCTRECDLIKAGGNWYDDSSCP